MKCILEPYSSDIKYTFNNKKIALIGTNGPIVKIAQQALERYYEVEAP